MARKKSQQLQLDLATLELQLRPVIEDIRFECLNNSKTMVDDLIVLFKTTLWILEEKCPQYCWSRLFSNYSMNH